SLPGVLLQPELNEPLNSYEYQTIQLRGRDQEALTAATGAFSGGIEARTHPQSLDSALKRFSQTTGLAVLFFRVHGEGESRTGGFVSPSHPSAVFLNADSPARLANIFAHEWMHCL